LLFGQRQRTVDARGANAQRRQAVHLVLHQGDQRRDDQRDTLAGDRGQLVAETLAPAGRHDAQAVVPASTAEITSRCCERFLAELFDRLWETYRGRVEYVRTYEQVIREAGATFVNDHIAFRTFATQQPLAGIATISRVFEALGYRAAGSYHFDDKQLSAIHFQPPNPQFPKLFISELRTWELPAEARAIVERTVRSHRPPIAADALAALAGLDRDEQPAGDLLPQVVRQFEQLPWLLPAREDVAALNKASQYAAWVLVHGYNVNHFTSLINSHGAGALDDIEKTIAALKRPACR
jgi:hypothetical protein